MNSYITYFEIAAFLASLAAWGTIRRSSYLRWFPLLLFVVVSVEVYETFFRPHNQPLNPMIYNFQVPLQHLLYLLILYKAIDRTAYKRFILAAMLTLALTALGTGLYTQRDHFNVLAYCVGSVLIIVGIVVKFYEMLQHPIGFNFLKAPFFYMLFAYLLFLVGTLPYFAMGNWLFYEKGYKNLIQIISNAMSILNYVLYSTYTIAFLWMIRKKDYS